jgi:uncharacterized protein YndB with AHSA1/START domain
MERKTKVIAEDGKQYFIINREFDLPVDLLFTAFIEPEIFEQWMSHEYGTTKVLKLESKKHGSYEFQTSDAQGNVMFRANGTIHEFVLNQKITRTFEMDNGNFDVQLEFLEFEQITEDTSKLSIHTIFRSVTLRDQLLRLPFAQGLNMAHNRLQDIVSKLK